jgi:CRP-like cAMP-binding protein
MTEQQLMNELTQVRLLSGLTYPALRRVAQSGRLVQARQGQVVLGPGFGTTGFFVVLEGSVVVSLPFGPVLSYLEKGEVFGETALLESVERTAYCRAQTDCLLFEMPFDSFHANVVASDVTRTGLEELSATRTAERKAAREDAEPPGGAEEEPAPA